LKLPHAAPWLRCIDALSGNSTWAGLDGAETGPETGPEYGVSEAFRFLYKSFIKALAKQR
jgi:hypothetical protein